MKDEFNVYAKSDRSEEMAMSIPPMANLPPDQWKRNDLDQQGVAGFRLMDLGEDNLACCGDCVHSGDRFAFGATPPRFICSRQYRTSFYSVQAVQCPVFTLRPSLPDTPPGDERAGQDRRQHTQPVVIDRRSGHERRNPDRPPLL